MVLVIMLGAVIRWQGRLDLGLESAALLKLVTISSKAMLLLGESVDGCVAWSNCCLALDAGRTEDERIAHWVCCHCESDWTLVTGLWILGHDYSTIYNAHEARLSE